MPLAELAPDAARVVYFAGDAGAVPQRPPPSDAGWNQDELHHTRTAAAEFSNTDGPQGELLPRCPVMPRRGIVESDAVSTASPPPATTFEYLAADLPFRVEDAVLHINFARNSWRENILLFASMRVYFTIATQTYVKYENKQSPSGWKPAPRPRPAYVDDCLSSTFWLSFEVEYLLWRERAVALTNHLLSPGRPAILNENQRSSVRAIVAEADRLRHKVTASGLRFEFRAKGAAEMALATLLLDHPALADQFADEVSAAHPGRRKFGPPVSHRMLGPAHSIQGGTMDGPDPILLLQLDSDWDRA